jgi:hypothetical protein
LLASFGETRRSALIALIDQAAVIDRILRHLGLPAEIPSPRPARSPPTEPDLSDATRWDKDPPVFDADH